MRSQISVQIKPFLDVGLKLKRLTREGKPRDSRPRTRWDVRPDKGKRAEIDFCAPEGEIWTLLDSS